MQTKENYFIKNIEIKNFKCFDNFKAEGFARVNLIGGKNNVGKTAFMEAVFINSNIKDDDILELIEVLTSIEYYRNIDTKEDVKELSNAQYLDTFFYLLTEKYSDLEIKSNRNTIKITIGSKKFQVKLNKQSFNEEEIHPLVIQPEKEFFLENFVSSLFIENEQLATLYDEAKRIRKRNEINDSINLFYEDLEEYDFIDGSPKCFSTQADKFIDLSEYGHGLKRYIAFISAIWANKDGYLFLDEIENGIHYSNLDKLWEIILTTLKEANCQLFATTHSKECIESYARVAKKLEDEKITFIELGKNKEAEIKAMVYPYEWFIDEVEQNHEVRGW